MDLLMRDRSTKGIRDYAGNVQQRGATLAGLLQGREPTDAQKALFNIANPSTEQGAMDLGVGFVGSIGKAGSTLYRGLDRQNDPSRLNAIDWYSETPDLAKKYGSNIITKEKPQSMNSADLGFRDYMTEVKKDDVLDRVKRAVMDSFSSGKIEKQLAIRQVDRIENARGGNDFKRVHEWLSSDPAISSILRDSGYDSLSHIENGTQTYGLFNK
jgi:hypothetical protein